MAMTKEQTAKMMARASEIEQRALELQEEFSYEGYQVVRRELFAHLRDAAIVIRPTSVTFNGACVNGLKDVNYVNLLVNPQKQRLVAKPCDENAKDALRWCISKGDRKKSRRVTSKLFCGMLYNLMSWDTRCRYKILGYKITIDNELIFIFDLLETEIFVEKSADNTKQITSGETLSIDSLASRYSRPYYPEDWRNSFGLPFAVHQKSLDIDDTSGFEELSGDKGNETGV